MIRHRSFLYVPGTEKFIQKSKTSNSDWIIYDLEDGVAHSFKSQARNSIFTHLSNSTLNNSCIRINALGSSLENIDLDLINNLPNLPSICIPKVTKVKDIIKISNIVHNKTLSFIACIESAQGLLNASEIASHPNVSALLFASEDYCADVGITRSDSRIELLYPRQKLVSVAKAYQKHAIDIVCVDYKDMKVLKEECMEGAAWGFTGKQCIHPGQVDLVNQLFVPHPDLVEKAMAIINGYKDHSSRGIGAFVLNGKMIDEPMRKWAENIISRSI